MFSSGFLSASRAYASDGENFDSPYTDDNIYYRQTTFLQYFTNPWLNVFNVETHHWDDLLGYNYFNSVRTENVYCIGLANVNTPNDMIYMPDVYDYYVYSTLYAEVPLSNFTFAPVRAFFDTYECTNERKEFYLQDFRYFHYDGGYGDVSTGFSITGKLPDTITNTNLEVFYMFDDQGAVMPAGDIHARVLIYQVPKGTTGFYDDMIEILEEINKSVNTQGQSLSSAIDAAADQIQKAIEDQYAMSNTENFGVPGIVDQIEQKMGVLSFGSDTLVNFLDLFDPANATNTTLTFPAFKMTIQGEEYSIWSNINYNLESLEVSFGALITAVRWATIAMVWIALLNYLVKAFDHIINKGAR